MKALQLVFICLFAVFLFGCDTPPVLGTLGRLVNSGATPELAVERLLPSDSQYLYLTKIIPGGAVVFFRDRNPNLNKVMVGHSFVKQENFGWVAEGASWSSGTSANTPFTLGINFPAELANQVIFDGGTLDPKIRSVSVLLADGTTIREPVINNLFGIITPPNSTVCRLEMRDAQNHSLYDYDFSQKDEHFFSPEDMIERAQKECK